MEVDTAEVKSERKGGQRDKGLRLFFEEEKAKKKMVQWLEVMSLSSLLSSSSSFSRSKSLEHKPRSFPARSLYPLITPREVSISDHVGFSFARNKINPNH